MKEFYSPFEKPKDPQSIKAIRISISSPKKILEWSHGEVKKPETINYRTFKPERDGLFCAKIFGPVKDYECNCGKYKRMKHRGIVCEKCGVEVIHSSVRRERMGHIVFASPVAHIWFLRAIPSRIGNVLDITLKDVEKILYCVAYIIMDSKNKNIKKGQIIDEEEYYKYIEQYGKDSFVAGTGAEVIKELLEKIDLDAESKKLREDIKTSKVGEARIKKIAKRLKILESLRDSGNRPEWMILKNIPVLPPDLRPLVPLDGGRFATSDLNDLYRRVINRNNRLKRLLDLNAPDIIIRNEKRMLQEAVDALFDNGRRGKVITGANRRPLKSLSDMLKGKQGRFRQNLLGKRVDYSGRSVIVVGPELKLHQCGLPKQMALELFKPFIYQKLEERGYSQTIKTSKKMVEMEQPEVWDILEDISKEHPVLLNRAPTLHRLGIQAFEPVLIEGKAVQIHPLVCVAYNADFDGDQMAVHLPLSVEAQIEARVLMMSSNNILSPANGRSVIAPTQDIVLGIYFLTRERPFSKGEGKIFSSPEEVRIAYDLDEVHIQAKIKCRIRGKFYDTTVGRILLCDIVPEEIPFEMYNKVLDKKTIANLFDEIYRVCGSKQAVLFGDKLRTMGFLYSTAAGISISIDDMKIPSKKQKIINEAHEKVRDIEEYYRLGDITQSEKYNQVIDVWSEATEKVAKEMMNEMKTETFKDEIGDERKGESFNPIYIMMDSGARGSAMQMKQLSGMRGLMTKPSGEIIETPITANFREGLSVLQYFISTHGARKGLADTALKTANSGYLTRRLVDVAQDIVITEYDCGTLDGIEVTALEGREVRVPLGERLLGRVTIDDIREPNTRKILVKANEEIDENKLSVIEESGLDKIKVRSVLTCRSRTGCCVLCYGRDLARGKLVNIGEPVGVIAAQSIGEPGTQLTMRTFHIGGAATRLVEHSSIESRYNGFVKFSNLNSVTDDEGQQIVMSRNGEISIFDENGREREKNPVPYGATLLVKEGQNINAGEKLAKWDPWANPILVEASGYVHYEDIAENDTYVEQIDDITSLTRKVIIESKDPEKRPRIVLKESKDLDAPVVKIPGTQIDASYFLPVGATIESSQFDFVPVGKMIAKIPKETVKMKDITGGLPRVAELFEARKPKELAVISEIDGRITITKAAKGKQKITVTPEVGEKKEYFVPRGKYVSLRDGDFVRAGDPLMDGSSNPHDILRILGIHALSKYLVNEIQEVYRLQGVRINDKHIEVIVKQMLRWIKIVDPGDSKFLTEEFVDKWVFEDENEKIEKEGGRPAIGEPILLGITKASLNVDSFISAASFQETTKVLTESALCKKTDHLRGLKENVIIGRLIPAGTGFPKLQEEVEVAFKEEKEEEPLVEEIEALGG